MKASRFQANVFHQVCEYGEPPSGEHIAGKIVAIADVTAGDPNPVHSAPEGLQNKFGAHAAGAGDADHPEVGRILAAGSLRPGPLRHRCNQLQKNAASLGS